ncbi:hypothetical protein [Massilia psychrophila]|nr:hypothetical protein [Massilia psychrophila]GGE73088.1 hypothetical protein GCM10008020_17220 [Massilia psychrophila]
MRPPDFARLFYSPSMAFLIAAFIVVGLACLFFSIGYGKPDASAERYWKKLSLLAHMSVGVGLIGLAVFAGRIKLVTDHQVLEGRVRVAEAAVGERLRLTVLQTCAPVLRRAGAPYNPAVAKKELCAIARSLTSIGAASPLEIDWEAAAPSLRSFSGKYPGCVPNVFTRHSDCDDTVIVATRLAGDIAMVTAAKQSARTDEAMAAMIEAPDDRHEWLLLLLAFLIAAVGVSIKCARAASELFAARRSGA